MRKRNLLIFVLLLCFVSLGAYQAARKPAKAVGPADALLDAYRKVPTASIADAVDQVAHKRGFLSHDMRPVFDAHIAGYAVTALLRPLSKIQQASGALGTLHSVQAIDEAGPGKVLVIVVEDGDDISGLDIAGIGGLMATDGKVRGLEGAVIDGGARDVGEITELKFPVFSRSVIPSSSVGRYTSVFKNEPVTCAKVKINPGDVIVGDRDGVVAVPRDEAEAVLKKAQEIDEREAKMFPLIRQYKSLQKVVELFKRI